MTSRQRGPSVLPSRRSNGPYYPRRGSIGDRDVFHGDPYTDRGYVNPKTGGLRDGILESSDIPPTNHHSYRNRTDSNISLPIDGSRNIRSQMSLSPEESRGRGVSLSLSPSRDDARPRSGQSNTPPSSRDKVYFKPSDFSPPSFPQNPYAGQRHSVAVDAPDGPPRSNHPNSRGQSPVPQYSSTPSPQPHRHDIPSPDQSRGRGNFPRPVQMEQEQKASEFPYQLAPLKFSPQRTRDPYNFLAGFPFDDTAQSPEKDRRTQSPPEPSRPPPVPPTPQDNEPTPAIGDSSHASQHLQPAQPPNEPEIIVRTPSNQEYVDEDWTLENVIDFLRINGYGEAWQQAFRAADIHGEKFRQCGSWEAKKLIQVPPGADKQGKTLFKLITLIRKVLNSNSDTPDSETLMSVARHYDRPETAPVRRDTGLAHTNLNVSGPQSNVYIPSSDSPVIAPTMPTSSKQNPRHISEQHATPGVPFGRHDTVPTRLQLSQALKLPPSNSNIPPSNPNLPSPLSPDPGSPSLKNGKVPSRNPSEQDLVVGTPPEHYDHPPKLSAPPPSRLVQSPQDLKRPSPYNVGEFRQSLPSQLLGDNRHSKTFSTDSNLSDYSLRSGPQARSSQDFQEMLPRIAKDGTIVPQKRPDKKKSVEQMPRPGLFQRFFQRGDRPREATSLVDDQDYEFMPMTPSLPSHPPYSSKASGLNNSQSSLDSAFSTPIDDPLRVSITTSISSNPNLPTTIEPPTPEYILPTVLWVQITQDGENFRRCNLSHIGTDPAAIRELICGKVGVNPKETIFYVTDIDGVPDDAEQLDDNALLKACTNGDGKGTLKFLLKAQDRRPATPPVKPSIQSIPQSLRPSQGMVSVPNSDQEGRDVRTIEDPNRGHYATISKEIYGSGFLKTNESEDTVLYTNTDYSNSRFEETNNPEDTRGENGTITAKGNVHTKVFEAAVRAQEKRGGRKRTESGGSERSTPSEESPYPFSGDGHPLLSPGGRRRPSAQDDQGFVVVYGGKVESAPPRWPTRQPSLPMSPGSPGTFRLLSKDNSDNIVDFSKPRSYPYTSSGSTVENLTVNQPSAQLPTRTPSGIRAQRKAPAPPQSNPPTRNATLAVVPKISEKPPMKSNQSRRSSDDQNTSIRRPFDDDQYIHRGSEASYQADEKTASGALQYTPSVVAGLMSKPSFSIGITPTGTPSIVTPAKSSNLDPMMVVPKRAPSPNTPGARLGITVNTNIGKHTADDSPPTEWQSALSPYSGLKSAAAPKSSEESVKVEPKEPNFVESDRFKESMNISFDDAPAFDLPDDDDQEGSLWAVKPVGVETSPSSPRKSSEVGGAPLLRKKSSLRKPGKLSNRPPLTVQIDDKVTQIPDPVFSTIAEEATISNASVTSSIFSESTLDLSSSSSNEEATTPEKRAESPEFTPGDDRKGLNSPMRPTHSTNASSSTPSSATLAVGGTDLARKNSFLRDDWAVRPPPDVVLDNLEEYFPDHDLDKPIVVDQSNFSPPTSPMDNSDSETSATIKPSTVIKRQQQSVVAAVAPAVFQKPTVRMKSIRVVAKEAIEKRTRLANVAKNVKNANLLRKRSTKVWGAKMLEMTPGQVRRGQIVTADSEDGLERRRTFKWVKGELIGKGTYGSVYLGLNATTGEMIAVKQVEVIRAINDREDDRCKSMVDALNAEIENLKDLDHPHIVQYLGYERTDSTFSIFLEYVPGGSVGRCLKKHGRFEESVIRSLIRQTLEGLAYLHDHGRLHRDLKSDNLLLDLDGVCKISDFGISKQSKDVYANDHYTLAGTIFWMAPEVILSRKEGYSAKIDIWSLGCVVLEMFAGKRPWSTEEALGAMFKLGSERKAPPIPDDVREHMSAEAKDFLDKCFTVDPAARPTAATLSKHPFCAFNPSFNFSLSKLGMAVRFGQK